MTRAHRAGAIAASANTSKYGTTTALAISNQSRFVRGAIPGAGHARIVRTRYAANRSRRRLRSRSVSGGDGAPTATGRARDESRRRRANGR